MVQFTAPCDSAERRVLLWSCSYHVFRSYCFRLLCHNDPHKVIEIRLTIHGRFFFLHSMAGIVYSTGFNLVNQYQLLLWAVQPTDDHHWANLYLDLLNLITGDVCLHHVSWRKRSSVLWSYTLSLHVWVVLIFEIRVKRDPKHFGRSPSIRLGSMSRLRPSPGGSMITSHGRGKEIVSVSVSSFWSLHIPLNMIVERPHPFCTSVELMILFLLMCGAVIY